jgi:hypothetical protein
MKELLCSFYSRKTILFLTERAENFVKRTRVMSFKRQTPLESGVDVLMFWC